MSIFNGLQINASGLSLERMKLDVASTNIANVNTTRTAEGGPYKKKTVEFSENLRQAQGTNKITSAGVKVTNIAEDNTTKLTYDPTNPDADANGYVCKIPVTRQVDSQCPCCRRYRAYRRHADQFNQHDDWRSD